MYEKAVRRHSNVRLGDVRGLSELWLSGLQFPKETENINVAHLSNEMQS